MMSKLTVLRQCADRVEAETIRIRLASAEIQALITGTDAGTALGLGGAATSRLVRVEVAREDYDRANQILHEDDLRMQVAGPWVCGRCHEQNEAAFDVCWCCNKMRGEDDFRGRRLDVDPVVRSSEPFSDSMTVEEVATQTEDRNPYRPVLVDATKKPPTVRRDVDDVDEQQQEAVTRCIRSAIVGMLVLPPLLSLYSVFLLLSLDRTVYRHPGFRKQVLLAWGINVVILSLSIAFWTLI
ncbi:MAG: putative signal transducing protein [Rubripirellula sp.]